MKTGFLKIMLLLWIVALTSCQQNPAKNATANKIPAKGLDGQFLYPLDSAKADVDTLNNLFKEFVKSRYPNMRDDSTDIPIKAFTISDTDLFYAMGMQPPFPDNIDYQHIRVYAGFNMATKSFKLFIVPVKGAKPDPPICNTCSGKDMFFDMIQGQISINPQPGIGNYVMDLNVPCPSFCDVTSPLMMSQSRKKENK